jgi:hypothetical protein
LLTGGDRGPAVVPGKPEESWLLKAISHADSDLTMPPKRDKLPASAVADVEKWIRLGAPDPRTAESAKAGPAVDLETGRHFWSLQKPVRPAIPQTSDPAWARQRVDHFILAKLDASGLKPSPDAKPATLLRRLHFDLIGLPPSPAAIRQFLKRVQQHGLDAALQTEVDRLLATPQFGERWGRHWLDVARYAESSGKEANISFPYAWRYRDYVIDCFNEDLPYDRFLTEQIAGDLLPYDDDAERARLLVATGFLAIGSKNLDEADPKQFAADLVDEQIDSLSRAVLANSIACARCHDHKFDPFTMEDYYALAGIFRSTKTYFGTAVSPANRVGGDPLPLPRGAGAAVFHASLPAERVEKLKAQLASLKQEQKEKEAAAMKAALAGENAEGIFSIRDALRIFWTSGGIEGQLERVDAEGKALPLAMGVLDETKIVDARLMERGDVHREAGVVSRGFPKVFTLDAPEIPSQHSGRLELADWLTHPDHPLTARVMVNRIWHYLFGAGLVPTMDNFGFSGERPSHPELLDDLTVEFVDGGWSVKKMVRQLVLSRTYRQASDYRDDAFRADPDNRLLWRASKRRLDAEAIRDAMLAASGELDLQRPAGSLVAKKIGDRPISLIGLDPNLPVDLDGSLHRSVYLPVLRDRLPDVLDLFDFAEPSLVTGQRETTNVPLQALYLLNSPFVLARAQGLADRLLREADAPDERMGRAFMLCFGRAPDKQELQMTHRFLERAVELAENDEQGSQQAWAALCQSLLASAELRNLD